MQVASGRDAEMAEAVAQLSVAATPEGAEAAGGAADLEATGAAVRPNRRAGGKNRAARRRAAERRGGN